MSILKNKSDIMLVALNEKGNKIYSNEANKNEKYFCPECKSPLVFRNGRKNVAHFAHIEDNICHFRKEGGESIVHDNMKQSVKFLLDKANPDCFSDLEYRLKGINRIADVYYETPNGDKIAIECIHKHDNIDDYLSKINEYGRNGINSIWVFNLYRFLNKSNDFKETIRRTELMKICQENNNGKLLAVDFKNNVFYNLYLEPTYYYVEPYEKIDWDSWDGHSNPEELIEIKGGYEKQHKSQCSIQYELEDDLKITDFINNSNLSIYDFIENESVGFVVNSKTFNQYQQDTFRVTAYDLINKNNEIVFGDCLGIFLLPSHKQLINSITHNVKIGSKIIVKLVKKSVKLSNGYHTPNKYSIKKI